MTVPSWSLLRRRNISEEVAENIKEQILYYINNQQDVTLAVLFISHCKITLTCFGRFLRPSSGVLKTAVAATGACHGSG